MNPEPEDAEFIPFWRSYASRWARNLLNRDPRTWAILDTETTGATSKDEIVQVSAINGAGMPLLSNWLVQPTCTIAAEATAVHHITHLDVYDKPGFIKTYYILQKILAGRLLVCYNANFDVRMLHQSAEAVGIDAYFGYTSVQCAMEMYALWFGDWNPKYLSFRWQKLEGGDHSSLGDCIATYEAIMRMSDDDS